MQGVLVASDLHASYRPSVLTFKSKEELGLRSLSNHVMSILASYIMVARVVKGAIHAARKVEHTCYQSRLSYAFITLDARLNKRRVVLVCN